MTNGKKEESKFICINALVEHNRKDGFYRKGLTTTLDTNTIYINKEFITEITAPKKRSYYKYKNYSNDYDYNDGVFFSISISSGNKYWLQEKEFEKFKNIL